MLKQFIRECGFKRNNLKSTKATSILKPNTQENKEKNVTFNVEEHRKPSRFCRAFNNEPFECKWGTNCYYRHEQAPICHHNKHNINTPCGCQYRHQPEGTPTHQAKGRSKQSSSAGGVEELSSSPWCVDERASSAAAEGVAAAAQPRSVGSGMFDQWPQVPVWPSVGRRVSQDSQQINSPQGGAGGNNQRN